MQFEKVCDLAHLADGEAARVGTSVGHVTLFRVEGDYFATQDKCSHGEWALADGYLDGHEIECPLHGGKFCVRTGAVTAFPPTVALKTYPVRVEDGAVFVGVGGDGSGDA